MISTPLEAVTLQIALDDIKKFYGEKRAERSGVPLINHITEGLSVLDAIDADAYTKAAFCYHPMFQSDRELFDNRRMLYDMHAWVVTLVMEYRNIANASLSDIVGMGWDGNNDESWRVPILKRPIKLSPMVQVKQMLVADKVQNRKDFILYHWKTHARSKELMFYFESWLKTLGCYEDYPNLLEAIYAGQNND
jgi:hypothetical protein